MSVHFLFALCDAGGVGTAPASNPGALIVERGRWRRDDGCLRTRSPTDALWAEPSCSQNCRHRCLAVEDRTVEAGGALAPLPAVQAELVRRLPAASG